MGKRYFCEVCDKTFADNPTNRRNHMKGLTHQRLRQQHYDSFRSKYRCHSFSLKVNPYNAEAIFVQSTRTQIFLKIIKTRTFWYWLNSSCWVLSNEYHVPGFLSFFGSLSHHFVKAKLVTSSIRVKKLIHLPLILEAARSSLTISVSSRPKHIWE